MHNGFGGRARRRGYLNVFELRGHQRVLLLGVDSFGII